MMWSSKDPLQRNVILKEGTWKGKILNENTGHKEVEPYLYETKRLIENPYYIVTDLVEIEPGKKTTHPTRQEYFDIIQSKTNTGFILLKAIVDHKTDPSEVVTVFKSKKLNGLTTEGGVIYVRPQSTEDKKEATE